MKHKRSLEDLSLKDRKQIIDIREGKALPPLYSDIIAKRLFSPDTYPDRLNFLMREIAKDSTIDVRSSATNESFRQSIHSKGMVLDIPSWLKDDRAADMEIQKVKQNLLLM